MKPALNFVLLALMFFFAAYDNAAAQTEVPIAPESQTVLPPPPVKVLQNRFFNKALRPEVSIFAGTVLSEAYTDSSLLGARFGFFVNEWVGAEYTFASFQVQDSADREALRKIEVYQKKDQVSNSGDCAEDFCKSTISPSYVSLEQLHAFTATLAPIYGKINLFDQLILYSDIYASAGFGILETSQGVKSPFIFGFGQRFYFAKRFNVRIDAWDHVFQQERENLGVKKKSIKHAWTVALGASVFLW